jgi:hypothetical protein
MGGGHYSDEDFSVLSKSYASKSTHEIYNRNLHQELDPKRIKIRESRDSADHPASTPIIIGLDVTGSMSPVLDHMARKGLDTLVKAIYERKPVTDPHIMCMGIGDIEAADQAPLQVTQFEADIRIAKQLTHIWLEEGGGGNDSESYTLPWWFALNKTVVDSVEKRKKKGYIFTVGDECIPTMIRASRMGKVTDEKLLENIDSEKLYKEVSEKYNVYHLMVEEGNFYRGHEKEVKSSWTKVISQHAIPLSDHKKMAEVIVSTIQINEGMDPDEVAGSWDKATSETVKRAVINLRK